MYHIEIQDYLPINDTSTFVIDLGPIADPEGETYNISIVDMPSYITIDQDTHQIIIKISEIPTDDVARTVYTLGVTDNRG